MAAHAVLEGVDMSGPAAQFAGPAASAPPGTGRSGWPLGNACLSGGRRWRVTISAVRPGVLRMAGVNRVFPGQSRTDRGVVRLGGSRRTSAGTAPAALRWFGRGYRG